MTVPKLITCRLCGAKFKGAGAIGRLSKHRKLKHPGAKRKRKRKKDSGPKRDGQDLARVQRALPEIHIHINQ